MSPNRMSFVPLDIGSLHPQQRSLVYHTGKILTETSLGIGLFLHLKQGPFVVG